MQTYKCPSCGGGITFDTITQKLKCPYCDTEFDIQSLEAYAEAISDNKTPNHWDLESKCVYSDEEKGDLQKYICQSCGGEIVTTRTTSATTCPYCDNPIILSEKFQGVLKPDYVIPFKLDKQQAKMKLKNHLKAKKLLPAIFKEEQHIDEIKGIYVPFWLFDSACHGSVYFQGIKQQFWSDSDYNYVKTSYYSIMREGNLEFNHVPVDGSSKMDDHLIQSLEPYDFKDAVDFHTAYLAGYFAEQYDVDQHQCMDIANNRIRTSTEQLFYHSVKGYQSLNIQNSHIQVQNGTIRYALYPVWLLNTTWNGNRYVFAMNGQTGKFIGDLPIDSHLVKKYFFQYFFISLSLLLVFIGILWWFRII